MEDKKSVVAWVAAALAVVLAVIIGSLQITAAVSPVTDNVNAVSAQVATLSAQVSALSGKVDQLAAAPLAPPVVTPATVAAATDNSIVLATPADASFVLRGTAACTGTWSLTEAAAGPPSKLGYDVGRTPVEGGKTAHGNTVYVQTLAQNKELTVGTEQFRTDTDVVIMVGSSSSLPVGCTLSATEK